MSCVLNKDARPYSIKVIKNKRMVTVKLLPGLNSIDDDAWKAVKDTGYCKLLKAGGHIEFGKRIDDMELEQETEEAMVKETPLPPNYEDEGKAS